MTERYERPVDATTSARRAVTKCNIVKSNRYTLVGLDGYFFFISLTMSKINVITLIKTKFDCSARFTASKIVILPTSLLLGDGQHVVATYIITNIRSLFY